MALKYFFEYNDNLNILHRCEISSDDFVGASTEIQGRCFIDHPEVDGPLEAIRGSGMKIDLEATSLLTFNDLYTEEEKTFKVTHTSNAQVLFSGFLKPDGLFEDFVNDKWVISLDCVDGLSLLENLSYVDSVGFFFVGKQRELDIVVNCLKRTGLTQNINTAINIRYPGLTFPSDTLAGVYLNADRFVKDDGNTIMQCDEVLRSVLEKYAACICQHEGEWYIFKPNEIFLNQSVEFYRYDSDGIPLSPTTKTLDLSLNIGSQSNDKLPHHCNENQRIETVPSIGAYRVNYKYGLISSLSTNDALVSSGGVLPGWTINSLTYLSIPASERGVDLELKTTSPVLSMTSTALASTLGDRLSIIYEYQRQVGFLPMYLTFKIVLIGGSTYYYDISNGTFSTTDTGEQTIRAEADAFQTSTINLPALPTSGDLHIEFYSSLPVGIGTVGSLIYVSAVRIKPDENSLSDIRGEFHTVQRTTKPSANIKDVKTISVGDSPSNIYDGAIFESDQTTPTGLWTRTGLAENIGILRIMADETMRMSAKPARKFSGDVYGYFPYLSAITIDNVTGLFMVLSYSYDTKNNITSMTAIEILGDELVDIDYELSLDYGNTVKPTIRG